MAAMVTVGRHASEDELDMEMRFAKAHPRVKGLKRREEPAFGFRGCDEALFSEKQGLFSEKGWRHFSVKKRVFQ